MVPVVLVILSCVPVLVPTGFTLGCTPKAVMIYADEADCAAAANAINRAPALSYGHCLPITPTLALKPVEQGS
ncbi:MAG TPA: hypothetical protein VM487_11610 [Phycisphaerae bacterium]|nr:hypothetical protein [Phycisphaerae bacterium]